MRIQWAIIGFVFALALSATAGYAVQEFTLDEARTRIELLEARVSALEATIAAGNGGTPEAFEMHTITGTVVIGSSQHFALEGRGPYDIGDPCHGMQVSTISNQGRLFVHSTRRATLSARVT
jgi:hypothetical protein